MQRIPENSREMHPICLSQFQQVKWRTDSIGEKLKIVIANLPSNEVTLAELRDLVGQDGLLLLTAFLSIVFMVPVSIPGVSTVFGAAILLVGISRFRNRNLWLPKRIAQRMLPAERLRAALNQGAKWLHRLEHVSRPHRLGWLVSTKLMQTVNNCALIAGAVLLMAPFGLIPFSNTLPALALLFLAVGLLQRDGLCVLYGHLVSLATIIYFTVLMHGGFAVLREASRHILS